MPDLFSKIAGIINFMVLEPSKKAKSRCSDKKIAIEESEKSLFS